MNRPHLVPPSYRDERAFVPFRQAGPAKLLAGRVFYALPHELRRTIAARVEPAGFRRLQELRSSENDEGYTFRPFDEHRCIFVHVPKAAGVSIATALFGNLGGGHTPIGVYELVFPRREFESYFKFTFVRNPWDRLLSAWEFLRGGGFNGDDRAWAEAHLKGFSSFEEFVLGWVDERSVLSGIHFVPQYRFVCAPFSRRVLVDFVGKYEHLERDFERVSRQIDVAGAAMPHLNETPSRDRSDFRGRYTAEMREVVERVYRNDIELFDYSFDGSGSGSAVDR